MSGEQVADVLNFLFQVGVLTSDEYNNIWLKALPYVKMNKRPR
jgi:hypothetical protein